MDTPRYAKMGEYVPIKIPRDLVDEMDKVVGSFGFKSRAEIAKEGIRRLLLILKEQGG